MSGHNAPTLHGRCWTKRTQQQHDALPNADYALLNATCRKTKQHRTGRRCVGSQKQPAYHSKIRIVLAYEHSQGTHTLRTDAKTRAMIAKHPTRPTTPTANRKARASITMLCAIPGPPSSLFRASFLRMQCTGHYSSMVYVLPCMPHVWSILAVCECQGRRRSHIRQERCAVFCIVSKIYLLSPTPTTASCSSCPPFSRSLTPPFVSREERDKLRVILFP